MKKIVLCIIIRHGEILLLEYERGSLMLPGGHIEKEETPSIAAKREIHEELGLKNQPVQIIELKDWGKIKEYEKVSYHLYLAHLDSSGKEFKMSPQKEEGIKSFIWVNPWELFGSWKSKGFWRNITIRNKMTEIAKEAIELFLSKPIIKIMA
jgi:8-oxo-dGTP pyrophosphatase MutT (NUDIX family)